MIYKSKEAYVEMIKPIAKKIGTKYGYLSSVLCAQCILETGYGGFVDKTTESMIDNKNHLGMKSDLVNNNWKGHSVWPGKSFVKRTPEWNGSKVIYINDHFRIYDSVEQCLEDFCCFMTWMTLDNGTYKYRDYVIGKNDPEVVANNVRLRGYCTDPNYSSSILRLIKEWDLTKLDEGYNVVASNIKKDEANVKKLEARKINDITARNRSQVPASRGGNKISFIVCHYLGVPNADNPDLYGGGYGGHYNIQRDGQIFMAANPRTAVVWQCGGALQGSGGHSFYKICTNYNSIGIECGVCYTENVKDADGDSNKWYFTEETQESLVYLVSKLMDEYGISMDHVIRHYDVTGKTSYNEFNAKL